MLGRFTRHAIKEHGLELGRNWAASTGADCAPIKFADRCDFGRGAGKKCFFRAIHFVAGDAFFNDWYADFRSELDDGIARNAF